MSRLDVFDRLLQGSIECGLDYEFWPSVEETSKKLLILLHDRGDGIADAHFFPASLGIESLNVLFLRAPEPEGKGFSWYGALSNQKPRVVRSRELVFKILDLLQAHGLRAGDLFLCGLFEGCFVCVDVALRYPQILGGVVGVSGGIALEDEYPASLSRVAARQRIWLSHGYGDEILPIDRMQASVERLRRQGLTIEWNPLHKTHSIGEAEEMALIHEFLSTQLEAN
ncbi:MAG: hypothetical protein ABIO95_05920 [Bdellovibrionota bacterium]